MNRRRINVHWDALPASDSNWPGTNGAADTAGMGPTAPALFATAIVTGAPGTGLSLEGFAGGGIQKSDT